MTLILGIETSCDETAVALVEGGVRVRSSIVASQHELHREYGGVVPELASRAHLERIVPVLRRALADAGASLEDIDAVAVGNRPGLIGALLIGVASAKALAWSLGRPLIGVDHLLAHLYAARLTRGDVLVPEIPHPALGLVVSGGHTAIYLVRDPLDISRLGSTIDDAVGEAYDKAAAILGVPHPGGPRIDALAQAGDDRAHDFPIARLDADSLDLSYSGLKTSFLYAVRGHPVRPSPGAPPEFPRGHESLGERERADLAASFQRAAVRAVMLKLRRALEGPASSARAIVVGGGVSANSRLRAELTSLGEETGLPVLLPAMEFCVDNAAMIAGLAHERLSRGDVDDLTLAAEPTASR